MKPEYTWFPGNKFVSEPYADRTGDGSPRRGLEEMRDRHRKYADDIDCILATTGPEAAYENSAREVEECHPGGKDRRCSCLHTSKIVATRMPYGAESSAVTIETPTLDSKSRKWWDFWRIG